MHVAVFASINLCWACSVLAESDGDGTLLDLRMPQKVVNEDEGDCEGEIRRGR